MVGARERRPWLSLYDDGVPSDVEVPDGPLSEVLEDAAERWPASVALCHLGRELTYRELKHDVDQLSTALARLGVGRGARVALVLPNCPQLVIGLWATWRLGAIAVPLGPSGDASALAERLESSAAEVVLCLDRHFPAVAAARDAPSSRIREVVVGLAADYLPALDRLALSVPSRTGRKERVKRSASVPPGAGVRMWSEQLRRARGVPVAPEARQLSEPTAGPGADPAVLLPDGQAPGGSVVVFTARNLRAAGLQASVWLTRARPGREAVLVGLPLTSIEGITLCLMAGAMLGAALQLVPLQATESAAPSSTDLRPTFAVGPARFLDGLVGLASGPDIAPDLRSLRLCVAGPEPLPPAVGGRHEHVLGVRVVDGLSLPGAPLLLAAPVHASRASAEPVVPLPSTEVRVVDGQGADRPPGRPGELLVRGPQIAAAGCDADGVPVRRLDADGWLWTGSEACLHPDGRVELAAPEAGLRQT